MTTYGGATVPPLFSKAGGPFIINITVQNSISTGIAAIGGWTFPIDPVADRGHWKVQTRDDNGDNTIFDDNWSGEPPIDPPDYVFQITAIVGNVCDFGGSGFGNNTLACKNIANGGRWQTGAGVPRVVSRTMTIEYRNTLSPNSCPGVSEFLTRTYVHNVTFTG